MEGGGFAKTGGDDSVTALSHSLHEQSISSLHSERKRAGEGEKDTTREEQPHTSFNRSNIPTVVSQSTHASVIDTPYLRPCGPSGGTSCLPAFMCDSIMTPVMFRSPARSCSQMASTTLGWLLWFFCELPSVLWCW